VLIALISYIITKRERGSKVDCLNAKYKQKVRVIFEEVSYFPLHVGEIVFIKTISCNNAGRGYLIVSKSLDYGAEKFTIWPKNVEEVTS
jgi:hypothetical protein